MVGLKGELIVNMETKDLQESFVNTNGRVIAAGNFPKSQLEFWYGLL